MSIVVVAAFVIFGAVISDITHRMIPKGRSPSKSSRRPED